MSDFLTPSGFSGQAELTASNGLDVVTSGEWRFSESGYNDGATFGVSLGGPRRGDPGAATITADSGELHLRAQAWSIATIGNTLTAYTDPGTGITYPAESCRIQVTGAWQVVRQPNSNSFNSQGVIYRGVTTTDEGDRTMNPFLLNLIVPVQHTYVIQGAAVTGGAQDTFTPHVFFCRITESATTDNSNREFQSNSIARPVWAYSYSKSWQIN